MKIFLNILNNLCFLYMAGVLALSVVSCSERKAGFYSMGENLSTQDGEEASLEEANLKVNLSDYKCDSNQRQEIEKSNMLSLDSLSLPEIVCFEQGVISFKTSFSNQPNLRHQDDQQNQEREKNMLAVLLKSESMDKECCAHFSQISGQAAEERPELQSISSSPGQIVLAKATPLRVITHGSQCVPGKKNTKTEIDGCVSYNLTKTCSSSRTWGSWVEIPDYSGCECTFMGSEFKYEKGSCDSGKHKYVRSCSRSGTWKSWKLSSEICHEEASSTSVASSSQSTREGSGHQEEGSACEKSREAKFSDITEWGALSDWFMGRGEWSVPEEYLEDEDEDHRLTWKEANEVGFGGLVDWFMGRGEWSVPEEYLEDEDEDHRLTWKEANEVGFGGLVDWFMGRGEWSVPEDDNPCDEDEDFDSSEYE